MAHNELVAFLGLGQPPGLRFCLPQFVGGTLEAEKSAAGLSYPGLLYSERDVRSAHHVQQLADQAGADVDFVSPGDLLAEAPSRGTGRTVVLFGSRSNEALPAIVQESRLSELISFEFGDVWTIRTRTGGAYSLRDPSSLDRANYSASVDYGVIAGLFDDGGDEHHLFIVAGLGGRATEGCGLHLRWQWNALAVQAQGRSFAALLRFPPPVDPTSRELVEFVSLT